MRYPSIHIDLENTIHAFFLRFHKNMAASDMQFDFKLA